jgi:ketosteroid isomerase-like protein
MRVRWGTTAQNLALIRGIYDAMAKGDPGPLMGAMDPKIEWHQAEHQTFWPGGPFIGPEAVGPGVFGSIGMTFGPTFRIEPDRIHGFGDTVVMQGRYKGHVWATGNDLDLPTMHVWDIKDGKVVKFQQYTDTFGYAEATDEVPTQ